jgi:hypothetical protein
MAADSLSKQKSGHDALWCRPCCTQSAKQLCERPIEAVKVRFAYSLDSLNQTALCPAAIRTSSGSSRF